MTTNVPSLLARTALAVAGTLVLCTAPASAGAPAADDRAASQKVSVPAYFYPGATWDRLVSAGPGVGLAVANPHNGPGGGDSRYTSAITEADTAGIAVIGYVATGYFGTTGLTTRSGSTDPNDWMRQIKGDVDTWYRLYGAAGLAGIFFDEGLSQCGNGDVHVNRYIELRSYVEDRHSTGAIVVDNPGTGVEQCYTRAADTLVTFEGDESSYRNHRPRDWEASAAPDQIWHLVHGVPDESRMRDVMALSRQRNAGHVYATPDTMADQNPWDTLPPQAYWEAELDLATGSSPRR